MAAFTQATTSSNDLEVVRPNRSISIFLSSPISFPAFAVAKTPSCPKAKVFQSPETAGATEGHRSC